MSKCFMCETDLNEENIGKWNIPNTYKHGKIRTDYQGREWCHECTDKHDSIDWEEVFNSSL